MTITVCVILMAGSESLPKAEATDEDQIHACPVQHEVNRFGGPESAPKNRQIAIAPPKAISP